MMKTILFLFFSIVALLSFGCESTFSENDRKETIELGWLVDYNLVNFPDTLQNGLELNTTINVFWKDWCVKRTYFEVEKENTFTFKFTTKDVIGVQGCLDEIIDTIATFKFKPTQKGEYTLHFVDRYGTRTRKLTVY